MRDIKICLNMIVKNESKIITRLFDTILPLVDFWIISDTGSTDNTIDTIKSYFKEKNIPGDILTHTWKNFGHNRTLALENAQKSSYDFDYILFLDADMKLVIKSEFNKNLLTHDVYTIKQGNPGLSYYNVRLIKKNLKVKCVSPTHEYYDIQQNHTQSPLESLYIDDIGDGGAKQDKYERDIKLLKTGIEEEPDNPRYYFYLAQSYHCINDKHNAIETYKKRITKGGWSEEIWYSYYQIANIYKEMGEENEAIINYLLAYEINPNRVENIYEITQIYRLKGKYLLANHFADMGRQIIANNKLREEYTLFKIPVVYSYLLDYEKSIVSYYVNDKHTGLALSNKMILERDILHVDDRKYRQIMDNLKFYISPIKKTKTITFDINLLKLNPDDLGDHLNILNPSICYHQNKLYISIRCVNYVVIKNNNQTLYKIQKNNNIINPTNDNPVSTLNLLATLDDDLNIIDTKIIEYNRNLFTHKTSVIGIEDIRLISYDDDLYYIGNNRETTETNIPKMILGSIKNNNIIQLHGINDNECQKNWSPFIHNNKLLFVYSFYPLIILRPNIGTGLCSIIKKQNYNLNLSSFRGGSQGIWIDEFLYFFIHEVTYENHRTYYHRVVKMNNDLDIVDISIPFYLEDWGIEYISGGYYNKKQNTIYISWGKNDNKACLSEITKQQLDDLFNQ